MDVPAHADVNTLGTNPASPPLSRNGTSDGVRSPAGMNAQQAAEYLKSQGKSNNNNLTVQQPGAPGGGGGAASSVYKPYTPYQAGASNNPSSRPNSRPVSPVGNQKYEAYHPPPQQTYSPSITPNTYSPYVPPGQTSAQAGYFASKPPPLGSVSPNLRPVSPLGGGGRPVSPLVEPSQPPQSQQPQYSQQPPQSPQPYQTQQPPHSPQPYQTQQPPHSPQPYQTQQPPLSPRPYQPQQPPQPYSTPQPHQHATVTGYDQGQSTSAPPLNQGSNYPMPSSPPRGSNYNPNYPSSVQGSNLGASTSPQGSNYNPNYNQYGQQDSSKMTTPTATTFGNQAYNTDSIVQTPPGYESQPLPATSPQPLNIQKQQQPAGQPQPLNVHAQTKQALYGQAIPPPQQQQHQPPPSGGGNSIYAPLQSTAILGNTGRHDSFASDHSDMSHDGHPGNQEYQQHHQQQQPPQHLEAVNPGTQAKMQPTNDAQYYDQTAQQYTYNANAGPQTFVSGVSTIDQYSNQAPIRPVKQTLSIPYNQQPQGPVELPTSAGASGKPEKSLTFSLPPSDVYAERISNFMNMLEKEASLQPTTTPTVGQYEPQDLETRRNKIFAAYILEEAKKRGPSFVYDLAEELDNIEFGKGRVPLPRQNSRDARVDARSAAPAAAGLAALAEDRHAQQSQYQQPYQAPQTLPVQPQGQYPTQPGQYPPGQPGQYPPSQQGQYPPAQTQNQYAPQQRITPVDISSILPLLYPPPPSKVNTATKLAPFQKQVTAIQDLSFIDAAKQRFIAEQETISKTMLREIEDIRRRRKRNHVDPEPIIRELKKREGIDEYNRFDREVVSPCYGDLMKKGEVLETVRSSVKDTLTESSNNNTSTAEILEIINFLANVQSVSSSVHAHMETLLTERSMKYMYSLTLPMYDVNNVAEAKNIETWNASTVAEQVLANKKSEEARTDKHATFVAGICDRAIERDRAQFGQLVGVMDGIVQHINAGLANNGALDVIIPQTENIAPYDNTEAGKLLWLRSKLLSATIILQAAHASQKNLLLARSAATRTAMNARYAAREAEVVQHNPTDQQKVVVEVNKLREQQSSESEGMFRVEEREGTSRGVEWGMRVEGGVRPCVDAIKAKALSVGGGGAGEMIAQGKEAVVLGW